MTTAVLLTATMTIESRARTGNRSTPSLKDRKARKSSPCFLELQRMFEHSNIIRLRFSQTNFFYERTFVDARWSVFGAHIAERSFGRGLARGSHARMALLVLLKSCVDACQCHVPEISRERSGNMNFQLEEKRERQSF